MTRDEVRELIRENVKSEALMDPIEHVLCGSGCTLPIECRRCYGETGSHRCIRPSHGNRAPEALVEQKPRRMAATPCYDHWRRGSCLHENEHDYRGDPGENSCFAHGCKPVEEKPEAPKFDAPEGFRHTKERRKAKPNEWVQSDHDGEAYRTDVSGIAERWILEPTEKAPAGRELLEYREPMEGEEYAFKGRAVTAVEDFDGCKMWILKPLPKPAEKPELTDAEIDEIAGQGQMASQGWIIGRSRSAVLAIIAAYESRKRAREFTDAELDRLADIAATTYSITRESDKAEWIAVVKRILREVGVSK